MTKPGMTIKPRDPVVAIQINAFMARHCFVRLKHALVSAPSIPIQCDRPYTPLKEGQKSKRPLARPGLTRCPQGEANSEAGGRYVDDMADDRLIGEADFLVKKQDAALAAGFGLSYQASGMSLREDSRLSRNGVRIIPDSQKLPAEGILPDRHCLNPECMLPIDEKEHHSVMYCNAAHQARAKELRRRDRVRHGSSKAPVDHISFTTLNLHSSVISEAISIS